MTARFTVDPADVAVIDTEADRKALFSDIESAFQAAGLLNYDPDNIDWFIWRAKLAVSS